MNRRGFFRAATLGGSTVPSVLVSVSRPVLPGALWLRSGDALVGQTMRVAGVLVDGIGVFLYRCRFILPWRTSHAIWFTENTKLSQVSDCHFLWEKPPFWARILRLTS